MFVSQRGRLEAVRTLLSAKADVNARNINGWTALMYASKYGHPETVQALLAVEADVNAKSNDDKTALDAAGEQAEIRALLMQAGAIP